MLWDIATTYILPTIAVIIPPTYIFIKKRRENSTIELRRALSTRFIAVFVFLSFGLFAGLSYLSGGINSYYYLDQQGLIISENGIEWNITQHLRFSLSIYTVINLLAVSLLSGMLYSSVLVLPKICLIDGTFQKTTSTSISSITASASALATSSVCCSTSLIAVIAPSFGLILGPYVPGLLVFSLILLVYSSFKVVIPRIPLLPKMSNVPSLIN